MKKRIYKKNQIGTALVEAGKNLKNLEAVKNEKGDQLVINIAKKGVTRKTCREILEKTGKQNTILKLSEQGIDRAFFYNLEKDLLVEFRNKIEICRIDDNGIVDSGCLGVQKKQEDILKQDF